MKYNLLTLLAIFFFAGAAFAQQPMTPEEQEAKLYEMIDKKIEEYTLSLDLNGAQVFWVDSILVHNYFEMSKEIMELQKSRMSIVDAYQMVSDKWDDATYEAFHKILNEEQWAKYLKTGGEKEKKARDKRAAKRNK